MKMLFILCSMFVFANCNIGDRASQRIPSINLLLKDSLTTINITKSKDEKPVLLIYFSPDCTHCQKFTNELIQRPKLINKFKFYFITNESIDKIKTFIHYYRLERFSSIIVGKDYNFSFVRIYKPSSSPYSVLFNKKGNLMAVYVGEITVVDLETI